MKDESEWITVAVLCGVLLGVFLGMALVSIGGKEPILTDVLDEVCIKLYGNDTEWVDNIPGPETQLVCKTKQNKIEIEEGWPLIRLIKIEEK